MSDETGELCVICSFKMTRKFPEGFPDEWKFCCGCKTWGENIIKQGVAYTKDLYSEYDIDGTFTDLIHKIYEKVTMVGK